MLDPVEILNERLQVYKDRTRRLTALKSVYRSMRLPAWVAGADRRLKGNDDAALGCVQEALEAYSQGKPVHQMNRLDEVGGRVLIPVKVGKNGLERA